MFTANYTERLVLRGGVHVLLRLVTAADRELLRTGFESWSQESRYARFFSMKTRLTNEELTYLTNVDQESHFALGAIRDVAPGTEAPKPVGLGIARFIRLPSDELGGPVTAEAAIAVADEMHGQGLGRILFERLVKAGQERGIERFRCEVLCSNSSMKTLIDKIAPARTMEVSAGVMSIDFDLPHPVTDPEARESAMYRFFRGVAKMGPWGLIASRWSAHSHSQSDSEG
jgi:GNAT superfamily N-acetyltransferase